jgi:hypothetical protein
VQVECAGAGECAGEVQVQVRCSVAGAVVATGAGAGAVAVWLIKLVDKAQGGETKTMPVQPVQ